MPVKKGIFIGLQDLCSTIGEMHEAFSNKGYKVFSAVHEQNGVFDQSNIDFKIDDEIKKYYNSVFFKFKYKLFKQDASSYIKEKLLTKALNENDIFIIYHPSIYADFSDLKRIKEAGKKLICLVFGDDVRWYNAMKQWSEKKGIPPMEYEENYIDQLTINKWVGYLRTVEKYADVIVMHPDTAHMALRPYFHYYMQLNAKNFLPHSVQRKQIPVVAHAPSSAKIKGTEYVLKAVKELKEEGLEFEFRLMEKIPYNKVYDFYKDIDIMVVQLLAHGGGKQSYELLSCGKVVISRMQYDEYLPHIKNECPIIDAQIGTVKQVLKDTILNYEKRVELSNKGRDFVLKYHDVNAFCEKLLNCIEDPKPEGDYVPTFFRNEYVPQANEIDELNKWNLFVKECDWYNKFVLPGERAGLKF